ncbi:galactose-3-O-sulfotransferase 4-like [Tigriopus californicus]|uniref:galactose-3-O-sulfotransferase 4-like n=1 Tax=Tigriopus californicus TaxID=6832 RepID=UPI0027DA030F|nr:galactose-3-O-sulfotransferase 4-like [Tigriopus californicus]
MMVFAGVKGKRLLLILLSAAMAVVVFQYCQLLPRSTSTLESKFPYFPRSLSVVKSMSEYTIDDITLHLSSLHKTDLSSGSDPTNCRPKRKIGFLKTRKTASTTVGNILMRYGYYANLNFVLPESGNHLGDPRTDVPFNVESIDNTPWHDEFISNDQYEMAALHVRWNQTAMNLLLGRQATYITLLREPVSAFESLFSYYKFEDRYNLTLEEYIDRLETNPRWSNERFHGYLGLNQQAWQVGLTRSQLNDQRFVQEVIRWMDSQFQLVMIMDQLEESLVLLSQLLCLPLALMASLSKNVRVATSRKKLDEGRAHILREHQAADEALYAFFKDRLQKQIKQYGHNRMSQAVSELRRFNAFINDTCVEGLETRITMNVPILQTVVKKDSLDCRLHGTNQPNFIDLVRKKQYARWKSSSISTMDY